MDNIITIFVPDSTIITRILCTGHSASSDSSHLPSFGKHTSVSSQRRSWPLWRTILIFLGVVAILGLTIGLLVHFLAVEKTYYYQGNFHISGVTYNDNCEKAVSRVITDLSKDIETKVSDALQNSSVYKGYINSKVIKLIPDSNGSSVQLQLTFKFPPAKKDSMRTKIKTILHQMLKDNMASWNAVPTSIKVTGLLPEILQQAFLKIIDNRVCNAPYALSGLVTDTMLCAGFMSGEADACQNDSGGPLAYSNSRNIWHLVRIVSAGEGCGKKNKPGAYTRVTAYHDWINSKTGL